MKKFHRLLMKFGYFRFFEENIWLYDRITIAFFSSFVGTYLFAICFENQVLRFYYLIVALSFPIGEIVGYLSKYDWSTHKSAYFIMTVLWGITLSPLTVLLGFALAILMVLTT